MPTFWIAVSNVRPPSSRLSAAVATGSLFALFLGVYILAHTSPVALGPPLAVTVRYVFFPLLGLGLALGFWAQFHPAGPRRHRLRALAWIFCLAPVVAVIAHAGKSDVLYLHYEAIALVFPFVFAATCVRASYRVASGETVSRTRPATLAASAVGLVAVGIICTPPLLRDLFLPRTVIDGTVSDKMEGRNARRPYLAVTTSYQVKIDGGPRWRTHKVGMETFHEQIGWYYVTRDVVMELKAGDHIRAVFGAGTDVILNVEKQH